MGILQKMAWSKGTRIKVMIVIDTAFFLLELTVGLLAGSLALMADAFHMLNDIISLAIGLWAVSAAQRATTDQFTFGWVRAEILGAFFNAVFLIALCVTIILEALGRLVDPPDISNPQLMLYVGSAGLASNLVGFFVLGGHGHAHGGHSHDHGDHDHDHDHSHSHAHDEEEGFAGYRDNDTATDDHGTVGDVLPEAVVNRATDKAHRSSRLSEHRNSRDSSAFGNRLSMHSRGRDRRHSRLTSIEDMSIHPASFRQDIIAASMAQPDSESESDTQVPQYTDEEEANEQSPLLKGAGKGNGTSDGHSHNHSHNHSHDHKPRARRDSSVHQGHNHTLPKKPKKGGHSHSHDDMGMNAMILHVIGDALGNVGVMVTALIIWLTDWPGKTYADPAVSLFITAIILKTSIPLTIATARVLLQATPEQIDIQEIREDMEALPGVVTCHHIHVWQLSDTKLVASMHLQVSFPIDSDCGQKYMELARRARKCLHGFGIHSATIQPEFCLDAQYRRTETQAALGLDGSSTKPDVCLLECVEDCQAQGCCSNASQASSVRRASESSHSGPQTEGSSHTHAH